MSSSRGSSQPRGWTNTPYVSCIGRWVLHWCQLGSLRLEGSLSLSPLSDCAFGSWLPYLLTMLSRGLLWTQSHCHYPLDSSWPSWRAVTLFGMSVWLEVLGFENCSAWWLKGWCSVAITGERAPGLGSHWLFLSLLGALVSAVKLEWRQDHHL